MLSMCFSIIFNAIIAVAAIYDLKKREIPKWFGIMALFFTIFCSLLEFNMLLLIKFVILIILVSIGAIGGGDFKVFLVIAIFIPYIEFLVILIVSMLTSYIAMHLNVREPPTLVFASISTFLRELVACLGFL